MNINITGFIYHKAAEDFSDCCDRYAINKENNKFSIADGVSKSFFPGIWAELLVNKYVNTAEQIDLKESEILSSLQKEWLEKVQEIVNKPEQKYFVKNHFNKGHSAAATFVGLSFLKEENGNYKWKSSALGDSFLFYIPDSIENIDEDFETKVTSLSSKKSFEFDNYPDFFESRNQNFKGEINYKEGELKTGIFYLMTDALAEWFIKEKETARQEIDSWKIQNDFETRIEELRKTTLQNDDSAILVIRIEDDNKKDIHYLNHSISSIEKLILSEESKKEQTPPAENTNPENEGEEVSNKTTEGFIQKTINILTGKF